ncbi:Rossmann-like and DUF2520 domain-containing protein [Candidatus Bipolaricaulota bacterium]
MTPSSTPRLGFVGPGTAGTALARGLASVGYDIVAVFGRDRARLKRAVESIRGARGAGSAQAVVDASDVVFLTVPDDAIQSVAEGLAWAPGKSAVHCSGATSLGVLEHARAQGSDVGAFHPLQTFASPGQAERNLPGSAFAIEASAPALAKSLAAMATALGGKPLVLRGDKALYHASAVIACNYLVTLLDAAAGLWADLGFTKEEGLKALLPLVRGTIENLDAIGLPNALTGPVSRGDVGTIDRNIAALSEHDPETAALYVELARRTIPIARAKGTLSDDAAVRLLEHLEAAEVRPLDRQEAR